jgi:hypothetical protein
MMLASCFQKAISKMGLQVDIKTKDVWKVCILFLKPVGETNFLINGTSCKAYRRVMCEQLGHLEGWVKEFTPEDVLILEDEHYDLLKHSIEDNKKRWAVTRTESSSLIRPVVLQESLVEQQLPSIDGNSSVA